MILTCPECKSRYVVNPSALLPRGRTVRCAKCSHNWFEEKPDEDVEIIPPQEVPQADEATEESGDTDQSKQDKPIDKDASDENDEATNTDDNDENFEFPIQKPKKRKRPMPKGTNLPALQNHNYGSNKFGWISLAVFVTMIIGVFLMFQSTIVDVWSPSKKLYNVLGLDDNNTSSSLSEPQKPIPIDERLLIRGIRTTLENVNNNVELVISGDLENISTSEQSIPSLKVTLQDDKHATIREWVFKADKPVSNPGEIIPFSTSLPNPPSQAKNVSVSFTSN